MIGILEWERKRKYEEIFQELITIYIEIWIKDFRLKGF